MPKNFKYFLANFHHFWPTQPEFWSNQAALSVKLGKLSVKPADNSSLNGLYMEFVWILANFAKFFHIPVIVFIYWSCWSNTGQTETLCICIGVMKTDVEPLQDFNISITCVIKNTSNVYSIIQLLTSQFRAHGSVLNRFYIVAWTSRSDKIKGRGKEEPTTLFVLLICCSGHKNYEQSNRLLKFSNTVKTLLHKVLYGRNKQQVCWLTYQHRGSLFSQIHLLI
jgi:hypothetical protein